MKKLNPLPVRPTMCATCPFRPGSQYAGLAGHLAQSALNENSRICHSTGRSAIKNNPGKKRKICRGARDVQLKVFHALGVISKPTDAAWEAKVNQINGLRRKNKS